MAPDYIVLLFFLFGMGLGSMLTWVMMSFDQLNKKTKEQK